jgi:hypothetical protein
LFVRPQEVIAVGMSVYFVQTFHRKAGPAIHRHLVARHSCCRISNQTHLVASEDSADMVANGLTQAIGKPRRVHGLIGPSSDWTLFVAELAGTWAGTLDPAATRWVGRHLSPPLRPARETVFVAHWDAADPARRDRPDGYFRYEFWGDWIYPGFNTFVLRTRLGADDLFAGVRNKWRGARRHPKAREAVFIAELSGAYAAHLTDGLSEWLGEALGAGARRRSAEPPYVLDHLNKNSDS